MSNPAQGGPNDPLPNPYLRVSDLPSTSLGLVTWNTADDHTGDYLAAGIGRVELDLKNFGPGDLKVRVGIERGTTQWVTSDAAAITLLAASGWQLGRRFFLTSSSDQMTRVTGSDSLEFVLQDVEEIRLLHSQTAKWSEDDAPDGALGIDNVLLPEPGDRGSMMCGTALLALLACRRRNRNTPPA